MSEAKTHNITYARCLKITKKSHSTLRPKRATFTFLKRSNSVTRQVRLNRTKVCDKCRNATFGVIFKQCAYRYLTGNDGSGSVMVKTWLSFIGLLNGGSVWHNLLNRYRRVKARTTISSANSTDTMSMPGYVC